MIFVVDFGSQTTHLIKRRVWDIGVDVKIVDPKDALVLVEKENPTGIILSGGPASVYEKNAPEIEKKIFSLGIPILGICYGWQLMAKLMGGRVVKEKSEYGPTSLRVLKFSDLFFGLPDQFRVFESHGDSVDKIPPGFETIGKTERVAHAAVRKGKNIYGFQFHPEMAHTEYGKTILKNFATRVCNEAIKPRKLDTPAMIDEIKKIVGERYVIGALSGGTDSLVAGVLVARAIGDKFIPFYVESSLMRKGTLKIIKTRLPGILKVPVRVIRAKGKFLKALKKVVDPEEKRKTIGKLYIKLFEKEAERFGKDVLLLQGTTYADFIHSQGSRRSAHIKSHHNVGGLPKKMKLTLLEPLRYFYTDEVRNVGVELGIPEDLVYQQPFPGPGHAARIIGEVTIRRLNQQVQADSIVVEELKKVGWYKKVFQCWSIMSGTKSTGVKGDGRYYGEVVIVRVIQSQDRMTADWARLPYEVLSKISTRIVNEVPGISRACYDITSKPPATMEWE